MQCRTGSESPPFQGCPFAGRGLGAVSEPEARRSLSIQVRQECPSLSAACEDTQEKAKYEPCLQRGGRGWQDSHDDAEKQNSQNDIVALHEHEVRSGAWSKPSSCSHQHEMRQVNAPGTQAGGFCQNTAAGGASKPAKHRTHFQNCCWRLMTSGMLGMLRM